MVVLGSGEPRPGLGQTLPVATSTSVILVQCRKMVLCPASRIHKLLVLWDDPRDLHPDPQDSEMSPRITVHYTVLGPDCIPPKFACWAPNPSTSERGLTLQVIK